MIFAIRRFRLADQMARVSTPRQVCGFRRDDMAAQLCAAWVENAQLKAALVQAQAEAREWQDAYNGMVEGKAFYEGLFNDKCKEATR